MTRKLTSILVLSLTAAGLGFAGCADKRSETSTPSASISVESSKRDLVAGETATFVARSSDTYGRDAKIKWSSTAGKLTTEQNGRVARVTFNETGTYTVKATLLVDGREMESNLVEVRVRPVP